MSQKTSSQLVAGVTGATGAIGYAIALQLSALNYRVVLLSRDSKKCEVAVDKIRTSTGNQSVSHAVVDLSSHKSICDLASSWEGPLNILINNAAITPPKREVTPEGIELQFATNVLGYFWMIESFLGIMSKSAPARIINVASYWAGGLDLDDLEFIKRPYQNHDAYRQSKQANRMLTPVIANKLIPNDIIVNACHPGDVNSSLSNSLGFGGSQSPAEGAKTPVWLAASLDVKELTGLYFENCRITPCRFSKDHDQANKLYKICQSYA